MTQDAFQSLLERLTETQRLRNEKEMKTLRELLAQSYQLALDEFAEAIITWLARKCGAVKGIFWKLSEDEHPLKLNFSGGFACTAEQSGQPDPHGIYRPVLKDQEVIFSKTLEGLFYDTATFRLPLRSWLVLPITLNDRLLAVIELYHPNQFRNEDLHILWESCMPIAAAWSGASEQEKRKALIEQLHYQNEEIRTQEEELRQHTEELLAINENLEQVQAQLREKNKDLSRTKAMIEKKNENIMASIQYAQRIQRAMLPSEESLQKSLGEHSLLFLPRDVVSGDFYWTFRNGQGTWVAAVDCTGHGVPAALMGMMGINLLEHIMSTSSKLTPADVLHYLDERVRTLLSAGGNNTKDGMDMSLCLLDQKNSCIHYAGAMNSAYYFSKNGMERLQHTRTAIGGHRLSRKRHEFTNVHTPMTQNGMLYLCSDGFQDQFGGPANKKFMRRKFLELLSEVWMMPAREQTQILQHRFTEWKGDEEQTDDVLVLGVRV